MQPTGNLLLRHAGIRLAAIHTRAIASERRLMEELDRERQETKRVKTTSEQTEHRAETLRVQFETDNKTLVGKVQQKESELIFVRQALAAAEGRAAELRGLLDEQRTTTEAALSQLNQLVVAVRRETTANTKRKRTVSNKV